MKKKAHSSAPKMVRMALRQIAAPVTKSERESIKRLVKKHGSLAAICAVVVEAKKFTAAENDTMRNMAKSMAAMLAGSD